MKHHIQAVADSWLFPLKVSEGRCAPFTTSTPAPPTFLSSFATYYQGPRGSRRGEMKKTTLTKRRVSVGFTLWLLTNWTICMKRACLTFPPCFTSCSDKLTSSFLREKWQPISFQLVVCSLAKYSENTRLWSQCAKWPNCAITTSCDAKTDFCPHKLTLVGFPSKFVTTFLLNCQKFSKRKCIIMPISICCFYAFRKTVAPTVVPLQKKTAQHDVMKTRQSAVMIKNKTTGNLVAVMESKIEEEENRRRVLAAAVNWFLYGVVTVYSLKLFPQNFLHI